MADEMGAEFLGQRTNPLFERGPLKSERELGTGRGGRLGDSPGDRAVVGNSHDEAAPTGQDPASGRRCARRIFWLRHG